MEHKDTVEIEEHYKDGIVVKRFINGVEVAPDTEPTGVQFADYVITKKFMSKEEFKNIYGEHKDTKENATNFYSESAASFAKRADTKDVVELICNIRNGSCDFAYILDKAPKWDGHTSDDVLKRLKHL